MDCMCQLCYCCQGKVIDSRQVFHLKYHSRAVSSRNVFFIIDRNSFILNKAFIVMVKKNRQGACWMEWKTHVIKKKKALARLIKLEEERIYVYPLGRIGRGKREVCTKGMVWKIQAGGKCVFMCVFVCLCFYVKAWRRDGWGAWGGGSAPKSTEACTAHSFICVLYVRVCLCTLCSLNIPDIAVKAAFLMWDDRTDILWHRPYGLGKNKELHSATPYSRLSCSI